MRQIVLDTETTGLYPEQGHRIIEIGCVELVNRRFTGKRYHQYINPEREIDKEAFDVHGISTQSLQDKPYFRDIANEFMDFINDAELIIHNAPFDVGFINHELQMIQGSWKKLTYYCNIIDSLALARQLHTGQKNNLDALCKRYGIDNSQREFHGALLDAHLLAQVYLAMTGGQGSLFDTSSSATAQSRGGSTVETITVNPILRKGVVLKASPDELAEHENQLRNMKEKGKCLWTD